jgi:hypothetical protein
MALGFKERKSDEAKNVIAVSFEEFWNTNKDKKLIWIGERHDKYELTRQFVERLVGNLLGEGKSVVLLAERKGPELLEGPNAVAWLDELSRSKNVLLESIDETNASGKGRNAHMKECINDAIEKYGEERNTVFIVITGKRRLVEIPGGGLLEEERKDMCISARIAINPQDAVGVLLEDMPGKVGCNFAVFAVV